MKMTARRSLTVLASVVAALGLGPLQAHASETIDLGVIKQEDVKVVQKLLYPKAGRAEIGVHLGIMPFDAYVTSPNVQLSFNQHFTDQLSLSVVAGGGYSFKTSTYKKLESPAYGVAPYAYRYLGSVLGGVEWAPIYAKMNVNQRIVHFDAYLAARAGVTIETSILPSGGTPIAPTLSPGLGMRLFLSRSMALRTEIRDDLMLQARPLSNSTAFKQNANVTVGVTILTGGKG
jgi:outer membrane beta-barrel protein